MVRTFVMVRLDGGVKVVWKGRGAEKLCYVDEGTYNRVEDSVCPD